MHYIADYYQFTVTKQVVLRSKHEKNKEFIFKCLLLWAFNILDNERYGSLDLRRAIRKEITALCDELTESSLIATDILVPSAHIIGSIFGNFEGKGIQDLLSNLYTSKDTFTRVRYFS
jgi:hypothetical protein